MKDSEEKYMAQIKSRFGSLSLDTKTANSVAQSFGGVILSKDLMVFSPKDISIDEFGNARITVDPESVAVSNIKDKLDQLTNKFKKIFYLASGSSVRDEDNLAKILFENANLIYGQKTSASENSEEWSTPDSLIEYYKDKGINITHYEIHQYRVRRALEIIGINRVGIIERISYAGNSGYLIQLPDECYDFLDSWFFSNRIDIAKSVKIYQLVCYLCPEQTYKEMMQLTNAGMDGPKKFEFALKALGIPFSNLKNFESDGFTVIIDKEFLDFIDKIPNLKRQVLSLFGKDLECIHKAFEKRFADKPEIIEQTRFLRDKPNCDRIKFILAKLGIPYHNLKFDENSRQIDLEIPETLLTDLSSYLRIEVPPSSEIKLTCYDQKITEFGLFRKINYLHERLVFNELNAKRLNIKELDERVQEVTTPQKQVKISKVLAYKKKTLQSASSTQLRCAVICPKHILEEFRNLMSQTQVLGTIIKDPYSDKEIKIPQIADDLQPWHMQLLARNEQVNVTGIFNFDLYQGLMTDDQVVRLRCLAKSTTLIGIDEVKETGGYEQPKITLDQPRKIIVIDQVGFQWQWDHRNSGCLFFYPNQNANLESIVGGIEELQKFQKDMYQAIYGIQRPESPSDFAGDNIEVKWLDVEGRLYLKGVSFGIKEEFLQALYSAIHASEFVDPHEKILFRFLKNGIGYFKKGLLEKNSDQLSDINQYKLENARLEGILDAVMELDKNLPDNLVVRKNFFKKVSALQLPFSNIWEESLDDRKAKKIKKDEGKVSEEIDELKSIALSYVESIKATLEKLGIEYRGDKKIDACMPEDGFVVATTSNGNPHALFGNEGGYQSVGASIASNLTNPEKFQLISENFSQVERNIITEKFELKSQINQGEDSDLGSSFVPASLVNISNQTRSSQPSSAVQASSTQSFPSFDNKASCVNCRQS
jgi:hypothetical protein